MLLLLVALSGVLPARSAGAAGLDVRARYEEGLIGASLLRHRLRVDPAPEGKLIEAIVIDGNPVILPGDFPLARWVPWTLLNLLHVRTKDYIIAQELLFRVGDRYRSDVVEESGRILRRFFILSVARLVAARGSAPDRVVILVMTKDQWSLRLNSNFNVDNARLDALSFSFSENNVAGRNKTLSVNFSLDPGRYRVGLAYTDPRIWSTRLSSKISADLYIGRESGLLEGGVVDFDLGRPLFSLRTKWGWQAQFYYGSGKYRRFRGGDLVQLCGVSPVHACTQQERDAGQGTPFLYGYQLISGSLQGTRSFGVVNKVNLSAGLRVDSSRYALTDDVPAAVPQEERDAVARLILPRSEDAFGPYVNLTAFRADYARLKDIETLALSEDFQLGPSLVLEARYAAPVFGPTNHFGEISGRAAYRLLIGGDLLTVTASGALRVQPGVCPRDICAAATPLVNEEITASVRNVSPRLGPLRLHVYGRLRARVHDLDRVQVTLGQDNGLRGFPSRDLAGSGLYQVNVELRTVALNLWTIHVGAVAFYDGGDAPARLDQVTWHHDAGVGLRILIPQFNRDVLRLDLAFPFELPATGSYVPRFTLGWGQAF